MAEISRLNLHYSGYKTPVFSGKSEQRQKVEENVASKGFLPKELVKFEVGWFYDGLGIEVSISFIIILNFCSLIYFFYF